MYSVSTVARATAASPLRNQQAALVAFTGRPEPLMRDAEWAGTGIPVVPAGADGVREVCARVDAADEGDEDGELKLERDRLEQRRQLRARQKKDAIRNVDSFVA